MAYVYDATATATQTLAAAVDTFGGLMGGVGRLGDLFSRSNQARRRPSNS